MDILTILLKLDLIFLFPRATIALKITISMNDCFSHAPRNIRIQLFRRFVPVDIEYVFLKLWKLKIKVACHKLPGPTH